MNLISNTLVQKMHAYHRSMSLVDKCLRQRAGAGIGTGLVLGLSATLVGCQPVQTGFDSPAPTKRIDAIVEASALEDPESLGKLIEQLESPDPAARMLAIRALEKRTGETFGYDHAAPRWERIEAVHRWVRYFNEINTPSEPKQSVNGETPSD